MDYSIDYYPDLSSHTVQIDCNHKTDVWQDVLRCLTVLYHTRVGEQALDREFGIDWSFLDMPMPAARTMIEAELIEKTRRYEPRVKVTEVTWSGDSVSGELIPKVVIELV